MGGGDGGDPRNQREGPGQADGLTPSGRPGGLIYLSSYRMGDRFDDLIAALGPGARVAVVSNAVDDIPMESRLAYARNVFDPVAEFANHGLQAFDLDLRQYFGRPDDLETLLADVSLVWANGGNTFLLMRAIAASGLDRIVKRRVANGDLSYGGWSAGAVVAGPSLRGLEVMDDPAVLAKGYPAEAVWRGMGLVDFAIVPHFGSDSPEAAAAAISHARMIADGVAHRTLRDGEVIFLDQRP